MKEKLLIPVLLVIVPLVIWHPVFGTSFFMEDFYFLNLVDVHSIGEFFKILIPVRDSIYRPFSQQVLLYFLQKLFGITPLFYAAFFFIIHLFNGFLVFKLLEILLKDRIKSLWLAGVFATSSIFFTGLYSIVTSHFVVGLTFGLLAMLVWLRDDIGLRLRIVSSFAWFVFAVFSSEYTIVFVPIMLMLKYTKKDILGLIPHGLVAAVIVGINFIWAGEHNSAFIVKAMSAPKLLQWYVLRGLGLPEGVRNGYSWELWSLYGLMIVVVGVIAWGVWKNRKKVVVMKYELAIYGLWVVGGCLPFLLLPNHLNGVYFAISMIGLLVLIGKVVVDRRLIIGFALVSIVMGFVGVRLLMHTHWMVRRAELVRSAFLTAEIYDSEVIFVVDDQPTLNELRLSMYDDLGAKVTFRDNDLVVNYKVKE